MFKVLVGETFFHVVFSYEHIGQKKFGKRKAKTNSVVCRILTKQGEGLPYTQVSFGMAKQFQGGFTPVVIDDKTYDVYTDADCYKKSEGRKLAFERALAGMALNRADRSAFWAGYASMLPKNGNGETRWK